MASISFILRSDVFTGTEHQLDALRQIARDWNWEDALDVLGNFTGHRAEDLAEQQLDVVVQGEFVDDDGNAVEPSKEGLEFLRGELIASARKAGAD
jgi:hypothetical protein